MTSLFPRAKHRGRLFLLPGRGFPYNAGTVLCSTVAALPEAGSRIPFS